MLFEQTCLGAGGFF